MLNKHCLKCDKPMNGGVYRKPDKCPHCLASQKAMLGIGQGQGKDPRNAPNKAQTKAPAVTKPKAAPSPVRKHTAVGDVEQLKAQRTPVAPKPNISANKLSANKLSAKKSSDQRPQSKPTAAVKSSIEKQPRKVESKQTKQVSHAQEKPVLPSGLEIIAESKRTASNAHLAYVVEEISGDWGDSSVGGSSCLDESPAVKPTNRIEKTTKKSDETAVKITDSMGSKKTQALNIDEDLFVVKDKADSQKNRDVKAKAHVTPERDRQEREGKAGRTPVKAQRMSDIISEKQNQLPKSILTSRLQRNAKELDKLRDEYNFELDIPAPTTGNIEDNALLES